MKTDQFQYLTIEPVKYGHPDEVSVKGYKECTSGVLKGQTIAHFIEGFDSYEDAAEAYPEASSANDWTTPQVSLNHLPDES